MPELPPHEPSIAAAGADSGRRKAVVRAGRAGPKTLNDLPLFATDDVLGAALLGADRVKKWRQMAPLLERRGLPKVD